MFRIRFEYRQVLTRKVEGVLKPINANKLEIQQLTFKQIILNAWTPIHETEVSRKTKNVTL
jgi:hypothetical protein